MQEGAPKNPRAVGEAILQNLPQSALLAEKPSLAGPGFINVKISPDWLSQRIATMLKEVGRDPSCTCERDDFTQES